MKDYNNKWLPLKRGANTFNYDWAMISQRLNPLSITGKFDKKLFEELKLELWRLANKKIEEQIWRTKDIEKESIKMASQINNKTLVIKKLIQRLQDATTTK